MSPEIFFPGVHEEHLEDTRHVLAKFDKQSMDINFFLGEWVIYYCHPGPNCVRVYVNCL